MKICLVTAFPPSRHALNEYGFHIAREVRETPGLSLTVLGDDIAGGETELPDYNVIRCWSFNALSNPWRLLRAIRSVNRMLSGSILLLPALAASRCRRFSGRLHRQSCD